MRNWAFMFLVAAVVAGTFGFSNVTPVLANGLQKVFYGCGAAFVLLLVLHVFSLVRHLAWSRPPLPSRRLR